MRISAKARYAMASLIQIGLEENKVTVSALSESLGISKIFLEQVFADLKRAKLVKSSKGAGGGYELSKNPESISLFEILTACENALFEKTDSTLTSPENTIELTLADFFENLDSSLQNFLKTKKLSALIAETKAKSNVNVDMYYI
jgi:Rrf2 family protein